MIIIPFALIRWQTLATAGTVPAPCSSATRLASTSSPSPSRRTRIRETTTSMSRFTSICVFVYLCICIFVYLYTYLFLLLHTLGQGGLRSGRQEKICCCTATNKQTNKQTKRKKHTNKQTRLKLIWRVSLVKNGEEIVSVGGAVDPRWLNHRHQPDNHRPDKK